MKLLISAGDLSGDFHGSLLIKAFQKREPNIAFAVIGGERLKESGGELLADSSSWSSVGIFDSIKKAPSVLLAYQILKRKLKSIKLDAAILIDCPAFNLPLARFLFKSGVPCYYFFPPSSWKKDLNRAKQVGKWIKLVIAPFQETASLYKKAGIPVFFSGHPLIDIIPDIKLNSTMQIFKKLSLDPEKPVIGLFPGSRDQEIHYLLPVLLKTAKNLIKKHPDLQFALPAASKNLKRQILSQIAKFNLPLVAAENSNYDILRISKVLILASGTATLEAALYEKPMIIIYKLSPLTWKLQKPFLRGASFAGLPNLLAGKRIVPELIQDSANSENIFNEMNKILTDESYAAAMKKELRQIRSYLGTPGVMERVANLILETLSHA